MSVCLQQHYVSMPFTLGYTQCVSNVYYYTCVQQHYVPMPWTLGVLERPLGNARLQTACLIATLLGSNSPAVNDELVQLGTINVLLVCHLTLLCLIRNTSFILYLVEQSSDAIWMFFARRITLLNCRHTVPELSGHN